MHERQTPTNLLDGRPWACWGPPVDAEHLTDRLVQLVARRSGHPIGFVADTMLASAERGRYLLLKPLSITTHAAVYAAIDRLLARDVVVKIHRDKHKHAVQRAIFESQALARVDHPNIVRILDMGEHLHHGSDASEGEHVAWMFSVIELCDADLQAWHLGRPWTELVQRVLEAGRGLALLHELGFAHGDIKPLNILIRDGVAKLADFGNATRVGQIPLNLGGTLGFIAPEVFERGPTFAADVFALAATLWVCLFGELPYPAPKGDDITRRTAHAATMQRVVARAIEPPATLPPGLPPSVLRLLEHALDPDPKLRPSLQWLMQRLHAAVDREHRRSRRRRRAPAIATVLALVGGVGFFVGARHRAGSEQSAIFWTAAGAMNPLAHAEAAAHRGELDEAIGALYRLDAGIESLSPEESLRAARAAERIAEVLEQDGHQTDADRARFFAKRLFERAGRSEDVERIIIHKGRQQQSK